MAFDDLPKVATSHVQSTKSSDRLRIAFGPELYILREERPDYGTDFQAELVLKGTATNLRFQVQLKSEQEGSFVEHGKYATVGIETSRLNYLLRGSGRSVLVLYDEATDTLRYDWVDEIVRRLDAERPKWRGQNEVSVRIPTDNLLNDGAVEQIHAANLEFHQRLAALQSSTVGYAGALPAGISAAFSKHQRSTAELLPLLESSGLAIVSSGLQREVADLLDAVPGQSWLDNRRIVLVAAFAYYQVGSVLQTLSYCNLANSQSDQILSEEESALLEYLQASARRSIDHLTADGYHEAIDQLGRKYPRTTLGIQARLETLLRSLVTVPPRDDLWSAIQSIVGEARQIVAGAGQVLTSDESKWGAELELAAIEFEAGNQASADGAIQCQLAEQLGQPLSPQEKLALAQRSVDLLLGASKRAESIYRSTGDARCEVLRARALLALTEGHMRAHVSLMLVSPEVAKLRGTPQEMNQLREWAAACSDAGQCFQRLGYNGLAFRAARSMAECLDLLGDVQDRDQIIDGLRKTATKLGLHPRTVSLSTQGLRFADGPLNDDRRSRALFWQSLPDEMFDRFARKLLTLHKLPENRLEIIARDARARKTIGGEQLGWCKHIDLLQDRRHTQDADTHYARDPDQVCTCEKFGYRSQIPHTDVPKVIEAFKQAYCRGCAGRENW